MILNLKIDNYKGIENEIHLNTKASNKIKRTDNKCSHITASHKLLKTICIIGCNGSGKTSILSAVETVQHFISFPFRKTLKNDDEFVDYIKTMNEEQLKKYLLQLNTLKLGEQNINKRDTPTSIEIELYIPQRDNNISGFYNYKIVYDNNYAKQGIISETLSYRPELEKKNTICLSRNKNIVESQIGTAILYENNSINKKVNKYIDYYKSFADEILQYTECLLEGTSMPIDDIFENNKEEFIRLCNIADDKIIDVSIDENDKNRNLQFWNKENNYLYFSQLSEGTKKIIVLGSIILEALTNNKTLLIDEIEQSLHPTLVEFLLNLITSKSKNNFTQLIFTTHSPLLAFTLENDELFFINNHENKYEFYNITTAIKLKLITKDQNRYKAWINSLLVKNPSMQQINSFLNLCNKKKSD